MDEREWRNREKDAKYKILFTLTVLAIAFRTKFSSLLEKTNKWANLEAVGIYKRMKKNKDKI